MCNWLVRRAVARDETFRKADDGCLGAGGFGDGVFGKRDGFVERCGKAKVGQRDAKRVHVATIAFE